VGRNASAAWSLSTRGRSTLNRWQIRDFTAYARKLVEIANDVEAVMDGRIFIERVNEPFLAAGGSGEEFRAGIERAIANGWLWLHESGTYVKFTEAGSELFADLPASECDAEQGRAAAKK